MVVNAEGFDLVLKEDEVICEDGDGCYITFRNRLDTGLADPRRFHSASRKGIAIMHLMNMKMFFISILLAHNLLLQLYLHLLHLQLHLLRIKLITMATTTTTMASINFSLLKPIYKMIFIIFIILMRMPMLIPMPISTMNLLLQYPIIKRA
jgi:hypothetical protein